MSDHSPFTSAVIALLADAGEKGPLRPKSDFDKTIYLILHQLIDNLLHGFFEMSIKCSIGNGKQRELLVVTGKSHKFLIEPKTVPLCA